MPLKALQNLENSPRDAVAGGKETLPTAATLGDLFESATLGMFLIDSDFKFIRANTAFAKMHGYETSDDLVRNMTVEPTNQGTVSSGFSSAFSRIIKHGRIEDCEYSIETSDFGTAWLALSGQAITSLDGQILLYTGRCHDITARRRLQDSIERRNRVLERLVRGGTLQELLTEIVVDVEAANPGLTCSVLVVDETGKNLRHGVAPSLPEFYSSAVDGLEIGPNVGCCGAAAYTGNRCIVEDVTEHPNWAPFRELAKRAGIRACWSEPIKSSKGEVLGTFAMYYRQPQLPSQSDMDFIASSAHLAALAIGRTRYEQKMKVERDRAEQANKAKSDFLAMMSHEIRTPMNGILGMATLMLDGDLPQAQRTQVETIKQSGKILLAVLNDILDLSRMEVGKFAINTETFDLRRSVRQTIGLWEPACFEKGLGLNTSIGAEVPTLVKGDAVRIEQVLSNLLNNAIKFTDTGEVSLSVKGVSSDDAQSRLRLEIRDTGIGISLEDRQQIFEPFTQADGSSTRRFGGSGLGLSICERLVNAMGGKIGVESVAGKGCLFWFELPFMLADVGVVPCGPRQIESLAAVATSNGRAFKLLVAEDNELNRALLLAFLGRAGYDITFVDDGRKAVAAVKASKFDLVLMDIHMPDMDGIEACRRIRELGTPNSQLPIIAVTANAMPGDRERYLDLGMADYVSKPIDTFQLQSIISRHLSCPSPADKESMLRPRI
jgi:PAS domain S-box-containing protein